uniref:Uncharacterized protein n=1 Tax=Glossina pallidipes TaxID=7398 RepID=A0A1A9ZWR2_GLOPL
MFGLLFEKRTVRTHEAPVFEKPSRCDSIETVDDSSDGNKVKDGNTWKRLNAPYSKSFGGSNYKPFAGGSRVDGVEEGAGGGAVATFKGMLAELLIIPPTIPILPFGPGAVLTFGMSVNDLGLLTTPIEGIGVGPPVGVVGSEPVAALVPVTECNEGSCVFPVAFIAPSLAEIGMMTSLLEKSLALADGVQNCCTSLAILKAFSSDRNMSSTIIFETAEGFV